MVRNERITNVYQLHNLLYSSSLRHQLILEHFQRRLIKPLQPHLPHRVSPISLRPTMKPEPPSKSHTTLWILSILATPLLYFLSVPPMAVVIYGRGSGTCFGEAYNGDAEWFARYYADPYLNLYESFGIFEKYDRWWWRVTEPPVLPPPPAEPATYEPPTPPFTD
jgi:hypothetical protein